MAARNVTIIPTLVPLFKIKFSIMNKGKITKSVSMSGVISSVTGTSSTFP
jgi:hypothetical protein